MIKPKLCELCNNEAYLYCAADSAFLCNNCDTKVHQANFLVSRHIRQILCSKCKRVTSNSTSGTGSHHIHPLCHSCLPNMNITPSNSSTSSDCVSTTESCAKRKLKKMTCTSSSSLTQVSSEVVVVVTRKVDAKAEGIFVIWCRRLGLNRTLVVPLACDALGLCLERLTAVLPFRVCLAASLWLGLRLLEDRSVATWQNLKRLEVVSGVPAKWIVAVEVKVARQLRVRCARHDMEEGWAES